MLTRFLRLFVLATLAAAAVAVAGSNAGAAPGIETQFLGAADPLLVSPLQEELAIDTLATSTDPGTQHVGPVASGSPDSSTCGPDWAQDTFDRFFTIRANKDGTFNVYEQFKNGSFVTMFGPSPGACDPTDGYGPGTLTGGDVGTMHGYLILTIMCTGVGPCENPTASCAANCQTTADFLAEFFPGQPFTTDAFYFHYAGYDGFNKALVVNEWKNASCNRGGNHGDIANTSTGTIPPASCV